MTESKVCVRCGATLDDEVEETLPGGIEQGRCPRCSRPYVISAGQEVEPDVEPEEPLEE